MIKLYTPDIQNSGVGLILAKALVEARVGFELVATQELADIVVVVGIDNLDEVFNDKQYFCVVPFPPKLSFEQQSTNVYKATSIGNVTSGFEATALRKSYDEWPAKPTAQATAAIATATV